MFGNAEHRFVHDPICQPMRMRALAFHRLGIGLALALAFPARWSYRAPSPDRPAKRHAVAIFECDGPKSILFSYKDPQNAQDEDQIRRKEAFQLHCHG